MNVKFINLTALPAWDSTKAAKWNGLFVYVTEGDDKGLYFGQDEWKKLSNVAQDTTAEIHYASIDGDGVVSFFNNEGDSKALFTVELAKVAKTGAAADVKLDAYENTDGSSIAEGTTVQKAIEDIIKSIDKTNVDAATLINAEETRATAAEKANADRLTVLEGSDTVDGSVDKKIKDAIDAVVDGAPEAFDTLKEIAKWISSDETGTAELISRVSVLEGTDTVEGSVAKAVKDAKEAIEGTLADDDAKTLEAINDELDALGENAYAGVENADDDQFVKVTDVANNKQTLSVTLGEFDTDENGNLTKDAAANGLKGDKDGLVKASEVGAIIVANEKVTAASLNDLDERVDALETANDALDATKVKLSNDYAQKTGDVAADDTVETAIGKLDKKIADIDHSVTSVAGDTATALENTGVNVVVNVADAAEATSNDHSYTVRATAELVWLTELPA